MCTHKSLCLYVTPPQTQRPKQGEKCKVQLYKIKKIGLGC